MNRRDFLAKMGVVIGAGASLSLSGCIFGGGKPPARKSEVIEKVKYSGSNGALKINLEDQPEVESRAEIGSGSMKQPGGGPNLSPIGVAEAGGRGGRGGRSPRGTGRGSKYKGSHGRNKYHGGHSAWRENHENEIEEYSCKIKTCAIGYIDDDNGYEENPPDAGPLPDWDKTWNNPSKDVLNYKPDRRGWYRVGTELVSKDGSHNFGWEAVDFQLQGFDGEFEVDNRWKISPRL